MKKRQFGYAVLAASAVLTLGFAMTSLADWKMDDGGWVYEESNGQWAKDTWKPSGDKQYYLGSDGYMLYNTLLNIDESYYYVNSSGAMTVNDWKLLANPAWQGDELVDEGSWYYFGSNGRAYTTQNGELKLSEIGGKKYAFDYYGRMLTGWISETGERVPAEEWASALYYGDGDGDGSIVTNAWVYISVLDEDNEEENEPVYHFYFGSNGKKTVSTEKTIGGKKYYFDDRGVAVSGWQNTEDGFKYYGDAEDPYLRTGWFEAVPAEEMNSDANSDGTSYWYYASSRGEITTSELKSIDGETYGFNGNGELITGLKKITVGEDNKKEITNISSVETVDDVDNAGENEYIIYFADGNGAVKTGTQTIELDGTSYTFSFKSTSSPRGAGISGQSDGYFYVNGRRLTASEDTKYEIVNYDGKDYLLSESGQIQKKKKNAKDADGYYYCTDSQGVVLHGPLDEKCDGKSGH